MVGWYEMRTVYFIVFYELISSLELVIGFKAPSRTTVRCFKLLVI
jgi:hypothetical protein